MEWVKIETRDLDNDNLSRFSLDASFQGVRWLFVFAFDNTDNGAEKVERNSHTKYFLPRVNITNYNVLIDGRNFYDQPINDFVKQYDEIRKTVLEKGDDYTTGSIYQDKNNNKFKNKLVKAFRNMHLDYYIDIHKFHKII